jgi:elongation factor Ts
MTTASASDIKRLRDMTGAGFLDCKRALEETGGDFDTAVDWLRKRGAAQAGKRAGRSATEGAIAAVTVDGGPTGRIAALVEVNSETDFVARGDDFRALVDLVARAVLDHDPTDVDALLALEAPGAEAATIGEEVTRVAAKVGENVVVRRFDRWAAGDGAVLGTYIHSVDNPRIGAMVEVAGDDPTGLPELARELCFQIAASRPTYVSPQDIDQAEIDREKAIYRESDELRGKPEQAIEKIIEGMLRKRFFAQVALVEQTYNRDQSKTVGQVVKEAGATVRRFVRFERGEELPTS